MKALANASSSSIQAFAYTLSMTRWVLMKKPQPVGLVREGVERGGRVVGR